MRATILVSTTPGDGPDVADAVGDDDRFDRALATLGPFEAARKAHETVEDAYPSWAASTTRSGWPARTSRC